MKKPVSSTRAKRSNQTDDDSVAMIYDGCNLSQLAKIFRMERRDLSPKIRDVPPCGERGGYPIYFIHEVAPHVVKPIYDIETYIKRMNHNDLPKMVSKEFWNGQLAKQQFELKAGQLWPTDKVLETMSEVFKQLRMSLLLMSDALERESTLTEFQRTRLRGMVDGALNELANGLMNRFSEKAEIDDNDDI